MDSAFADWYAGFWNHTAKGKARAAYEKRLADLISKGSTSEEAAAFLIQAETEDRQRFEPTDAWEWRRNLHPATWLSGERWNDEAPAPSAPRKRRLSVTEEAMEIWNKEHAEETG